MKNLMKLIFVIISMITITTANGQTFVMQGSATPTANLMSNDVNDTACIGATPIFTAMIQAGATYQYTLNGVIAQAASGSNNYLPPAFATAGNQQIVVTVSNGTCAATDTINFVVLGSPTATLAVSPNDTVCIGTPVTFTATGGTTYDFKVNGVSVQNTAASTFLTSTLTTGQVVTVDVTNAGGCSAPATGITMIVNSLPTVTSVTGNASPACVGSNGNVTVTGLSGTAPWSFEVWTDVGGNPGVLNYSVPGTTATPNTTLAIPIPAVGNTVLHFRITDGNGCKNF